MSRSESGLPPSASQVPSRGSHAREGENLTPPQRHAIRACASIVEERLRHLLASIDDNVEIDPVRKRAATAALSRFRGEVREFGARFGVPLDLPPLRHVVASTFSSIGLLLEEVQPEVLASYGGISPENATALRSAIGGLRARRQATLRVVLRVLPPEEEAP